MLIGFVARLPGIPLEPYGQHSFRQSQTALLVRQFMDHGFDLRSPLPVLGPPYFVPMEFPLFQGVAAAMANALHMSASVAAGLLSLVLFELAALFIGLLVRRWFGASAALLTILLMQLVPFGWVWGPASLMEFLPVAASLAGFLLLDSWVARRSWWLVIGATATIVLAFLVKPTTAVVLSPILLVPVLRMGRERSGSRWRTVLVLLVPSIAGVISAALWTRYADAIKAESPFTEFLTSRALLSWNFGYPSQRFLPSQMAVYSENLAAIAGPALLLLLLVALSIVLNPRRVEPVALALVPASAFLIFTNLFVVHTYYAAAVMPAVVATTAIALVSVARLSRDRLQRLLIVGFGAALVLTAGWTSREGSTAEYFYNQYIERGLSAEIRENTPAGAGIIVVGCDWSSETLYGAERRGLMMRSVGPQAIPAEWVPDELGYVAYCTDDHMAPQLPAGYGLVPVSPHVDAIVLD
jgi:hypothetical protein